LNQSLVRKLRRYAKTPTSQGTRLTDPATFGVTLQCFGLWTGTLLAALLLTHALTGCRAPRDPDLDQRIALQQRQQSQPLNPSPQKTPVPVVEEHQQSTTPAKGMIARAHYDDKERERILAAIPGKGSHIKATLQSALGDIDCWLETESAPQTVTNFIALALGLRQWRDPDTGDLLQIPYYDGMNFHRTIKDFIIQTGNPGAKAAGGPGWKLERETGNAELYSQPGTMGMVDKGDDTHGGQFFITLKAAKNLASKYTAFGRCESLDLVRNIANADKYPSEKEGKNPTKPKKPVRLLKVLVQWEERPTVHQKTRSAKDETPPSPSKKAPTPPDSRPRKPVKEAATKESAR
jgi:peptidyl-prolyl cis-trans isomerase A (cyclophilin A)